jgi:hypothetical protein
MNSSQINGSLIILYCLSFQAQANTKPSINQRHDAIVEQFCGGNSIASLYASRVFRTVDFLLVFKRDASGVGMYRIELITKISGPISSAELETLSRGTSAGCAATIQKWAGGISKLKQHDGGAGKLLAKLREINLDSDICVRYKKTGNCVMFTDGGGGGFEIRIGDRPPIDLLDIGGDGDMISQNRALLDWARKILRKSNTPRY